jgi:hypothetical protein
VRRRLVLAICLLFSLPAVRGFAADAPTFDAHIHYNADACKQYSPQQVIDILKRSGVERALVSSTPNDGTRELHKLDPARIVAELRPYRQAGDSASWYRDPDVVEFLMQELKRGIYRSIGEFHLHAGQTDTPVVRRVVALAVERRLPLHAHCDDGAIRELFAIDPTLTILWAHAGMSAGAQTVEQLLDRYPSLWVELSLRSGDVAPGGKLDPRWRQLFLKHPQRFLVGTDTWTTSRWEEVGSENRVARAWLAQLPDEVARNIAYLNAQRLFPK